MTARLVVLASGGGTNLAALLDACRDGRLDAEVVAVVSDKADAFALERAREVGVAAVHVPVDGRSRAIYDGVLASVVGEHTPTLVVLAGFMRLLSTPFLSRFPVVNLHPALPGAFPGLHAIERAYAAWEEGRIDESGVMVHWVPDEGVDDGPVIATATVEFVAGEALAGFEARMHDAEHRLIVEAVGLAIDRLTSPSRSPRSDPTAISSGAT